MSDWGLTLEIVGIGVLAICVVLSIVTSVMWAIGKILHSVNPEGGNQD